MVEACDISVVVEVQGKRDATVLRVTVTGATLSGEGEAPARAGDACWRRDITRGSDDSSAIVGSFGRNLSDTTDG